MSTAQASRYSVFVHYDPEEETYYADIPALEIVSEGDSEDHAFEMAEEAIALRVRLARESGESLPVEPRPGAFRQIAY